MANFDFHGTWEDSLFILANIVNQNKFWFVIDRTYIKKDPLIFTSLSKEIINHINEDPNIYIFLDENSQAQLNYTIFDENDSMTIDQKHSGPSLELWLCKEQPYEDKVQLGMGKLFYPHYFIDQITEEMYKPPEVLKKAYLEIQRILKKTMKKRYLQFYEVREKEIKLKPLLDWIGPNGMKLIEEGKAGIRIGKYFWYTIERIGKNKNDFSGRTMNQ
jgi:hypothetical protein